MEEQIYDLSFQETQELIYKNQELISANINLLAQIIINVIHHLTIIESNIEWIFKEYISSQYASHQRAAQRILEKINKKKYISTRERNDLLQRIATELGLSLAIDIFYGLSRERNKLGHMQLRLECKNNGIPIINMYSKEDGRVDANAVYEKFMLLYDRAQKELDPLFLVFGIKSIYWRGK